MLEKCPVWDVVEEKKRTSEPVWNFYGFATGYSW
jgi:hypothetical protein